MTIETLPFDSYPDGGRSLLGKPKGDLARRGYGRQPLAWCGFAPIADSTCQSLRDGFSSRSTT